MPFLLVPANCADVAVGGGSTGVVVVGSDTGVCAGVREGGFVSCAAGAGGACDEECAGEGAGARADDTEPL